ncbi:MAG: hypothetical protein ACR652_18555 [Methylocystis sp.]|uniref:hypothetical protein n=1 Tax=Methylocystis sp. TaxID=1911079 RepID=UPI003DA454D2
MGKRIDFTTPVGRMVYGSLYEPQTTDYDGKPLVVKSGPNAGQARVDYSFGVAIPKTPGVQHWANEAWGAPIWALGHEAFAAGEAQRHDFAWKIVDGDSQIPGKGRNGQPGRKPCDIEGYPGHWVVRFSGGYAPKVFNADGSQQILEKDAVKPGYYVQVFASVTDNKPSASPGLYFNHTYVAFSGYGPEIVSGPPVEAAGFGKGVALPPGASTTPIASFTPPAVPGAPVPGMPPIPGAPAPAPAPPAATPVPGMPPIPGAPAPAPAPAAIPVVPNPAILTPPTKVMTAKANGATYEAMVAAGWTDALLIQEGYLVP